MIGSYLLVDLTPSLYKKRHHFSVPEDNWFLQLLVIS